MSKSTKNNKGGSLEEVKKILEDPKNDIIISSKGVRASAGASRVGENIRDQDEEPKKEPQEGPQEIYH